MEQNNLINLSERQENGMLRAINSISFDFTFLINPQTGECMLTKYVDGKERYKRSEDNVFAKLMEKVHQEDSTILANEIQRVEKLEPSVELEIRLKESDGRRYRWHSIRACLCTEGNTTIYVGSSNYIDSRKNRENMLEARARQDSMTGLLNKAAMMESVSEYLRKNPDTDGAMIVIDIDDFKFFNDCMGHPFGDEVIRQTGIAIRKNFGNNAIVGRIGGDEFLVYIRKLSNYGELVEKMGKLRDRLAELTVGSETRFRVTCSCGISLFPDMGSDYATLFGAADEALYYVKKNLRNGYAIYTEDLYHSAPADLNGMKALREREAVTSDEDLTDAVLKIISETEETFDAISIVLHRIRSEMGIDAIYINSLDREDLNVKTIFESFEEDFPSRIGKVIDFSHKSWKNAVDKLTEHGGYYVYDLKRPESEKPGNGLERCENAGSMLAINLQVLSQNKGVADFVSRKGVAFWTKKKCEELNRIMGLLCLCLFAGNGTSVVDNGKASKNSDYDLLTGLMKEDLFMETAKKIISENAGQSKLAVVYSDISNFKYINESFGYVIGDSLLSDVCEYFSKLVQGVKVTARFYADDLLRIDEYPADMSDEEIAEKINDINEMLSQYLSRKYHIGNVVVRSGVYIVPANSNDIFSFVSNANVARKIAKSDHYSKSVLFDQNMFEKRRRQIDYIQRFDDAIANNEFYVTLQPKVSGQARRLVGAEALVRWRTPDGREIYPDEFIPAFEKNGCVIKLDFYVYEKVMSYIHDRLAAGKHMIPVSMNVSRVHLQNSDFVMKFRALIDKYNVPTQYLELELTESIYLENVGVFNGMMDELRDLGIRISMDDFGSGYSSLNALNDLKVDLIKIDKIFMRETSLRDCDKTIIKFIVDMARNLSMQVLCEGVETDSQRQFLNGVGCDIHQGFLYSRPVEIRRFDDYLENEEILFANIG